MRALGASRTSLVPGGVLAGPWVRNNLWRRARAVPSLDLRFADNKSLVDAVTGASLVTFTRSLSGTYTDSAGVLQTASTDVPRFDHNPTTGESLGLLVEEQRTNLLLRSEEFNTTWTTTRASIAANQIAAPNGETTADKLVEDSTASNSHFVQQNYSSSSGTYTFSVYIKAAERTQAYIGLSDGATALVGGTADTSAGTITVGSGGSWTNVSTRIAPLANGWYRCSVTATQGAGVVVRPQIFIVTGGTVTYTGDGTSGIYIWGAQLEAGAFPTSYIPTTTAAVTRSADVCSITGSAFSGWYRQDEGTMFAEGRAVNTGVIAVANDGSFDNRKPQLNLGAIGSVDANYVAAGSVVAPFTQVSSAGISNRWATAYAVDNFGFSSNGLAPAQDSSGALPSGINALRLGSFQNGANNANGTIRRLTFWGQRLPNNVLQGITQ